MKELREIIKAFEVARASGLRTALATVVHVVGSAYRHEGARMLVTENGELTGAISGGCLEGDALRKARLSIAESRKMLVTYDTTDEDDAILGVGLGCNGIIQVLLEPIDERDQYNPINLFKRFLSKRQNAVLGTFFSLEDRFSEQPGTSILITDENLFGSVSDKDLFEQLQADAATVLKSNISLIQNYEHGLTGFIEFLKPCVKLVVFGAGNDAIPLTQFADILGWEVAVVDGRSNYVTSARFPAAKQVIVSRAEEAFSEIAVDEWTVAVLMTHNYNYDVAVLKQALKRQLKYIGALGPKKKLARMLEQLREEGLQVDEESLSNVFGPTGLDVGSVTPEEIALSIIAEIQAVLSQRHGTSLKFRAPNPEETGSVRRHSSAKLASCNIGL